MNDSVTASSTQPHQPDPAGYRIEPIPAHEARAILDAAIADRCGADWQDEDSGWVLVTGHDYMARLSRGSINVDFYVDLLGQVTIEESELSPAQTGGRTVFFVLLIAILGVTYAAARAVGLV